MGQAHQLGPLRWLLRVIGMREAPVSNSASTKNEWKRMSSDASSVITLSFGVSALLLIQKFFDGDSKTAQDLRNKLKFIFTFSKEQDIQKIRKK